MSKSLTTVGWREWCGLPSIGIPAIKAKVDTGATTSTLHAIDIKPYDNDGKLFVKFLCHPIQKNTKLYVACDAEVIEMRDVTNSGGYTENRYVIKTEITLQNRKFLTELTLTNRSTMGYRMLLGRETLRHGYLVDSSKSFLLGTRTREESLKLYQD